MTDAVDNSLDAATGHEEMPHDVTRRRLTIAAFVFVAVTGAGMLGFGLWSDTAAKRVNELSAVMNAIYVVMGGIVGAYFGVGSWERVNRIKNGGS